LYCLRKTTPVYPCPRVRKSAIFRWVVIEIGFLECVGHSSSPDIAEGNVLAICWRRYDAVAGDIEYSEACHLCIWQTSPTISVMRSAVFHPISKDRKVYLGLIELEATKRGYSLLSQKGQIEPIRICSLHLFMLKANAENWGVIVVDYVVLRIGEVAD
jgi:hypothetical protein